MDVVNFRPACGGWKFRPPDFNSLSILINRELWYASNHTFNDPFDSTQDTVKIFSETRDRLLSRGEKIHSTCDSPGHYVVVNNNGYAKPYFLCLCLGDIRNNLMWSHYAQNHSGVAFGFDFSEDGLMKREFIDVDYERTVASISEECLLDFDRFYEDLKNGELRLKHEKNKVLLSHLSYLTKGKEWLYEKERRFISRVVSAGDMPAGVARRFAPTSLKFVVFGAAAKSEYIKVTTNILKNSDFGHVRIYYMSPDFDRKELKLVCEGGQAQ